MQWKSKTLQKSFEKNGEEMRRLTQRIAIEEAQLQKLLCSDVMQITNEHQLQKCDELLRDLEESRKCLADAEEEYHVIATKATPQLWQETSYNQKHTPAVISRPRTGSCKVHGVCMYSGLMHVHTSHKTP